MRQFVLALPLLFSDNFEHGMGKWQPTDRAAWKLVEAHGGHAYSQFKASDYKPPHRSPLNIALIKNVVVGDFDFEADLHSTKPDYDHRDMCIVFGYQDPAHFYYVHFGKKTDEHANQIFIVDAAARRKISTKTTAGTNWDDRWHRVKIARRVDLGTIEVYFDDLEHPVMQARDTTFAWGQLGIGTFDDTGEFDNVELYGREVMPPKAPTGGSPAPVLPPAK